MMVMMVMMTNDYDADDALNRRRRGQHPPTLNVPLLIVLTLPIAVTFLYFLIKNFKNKIKLQFV